MYRKLDSNQIRTNFENGTKIVKYAHKVSRPTSVVLCRANLSEAEDTRYQSKAPDTLTNNFKFIFRV